LVSDGISEEPLVYVTVILRDAEGEFVDGTSTDETGAFELGPGTLVDHLEFSFVGYQTKKIKLQDLSLAPAEVLSIRLIPEESLLKTVEVSAERTRVRHLIDRRVIEVGKDLQSAGGDAATVLRQLPDVQMGGDGFLSLRGSDNVRVLVNGKPSPLATIDLLQQLPAESISRVEVITAPSAKQRAEGVSGIINIITEQARRRGFNGSINGSLNSFGAYRAGVDATLGTQNVNLFASLNQRHRDDPWFDELRREGISPFHRRSEVGFVGPTFNANTGIDWFINDRNEWSVNVRYTDDRHDHPYDIGLLTDTLANLFSLTGHTHRTIVLNTNFRHYLDREKEHFFEFDAQWSDNENDLDNQSFLQETPDAYQRTIEDNRIINLAFDYTRPIGKGQLEAGALFTGRELTTSYLATQIDGELGEAGYQYEQPVWATYALLRQSFGKIDVQAGLRYEDYRATATFSVPDSDIQLFFGSFFPSVHLLWQLNDEQSISLGYNRRTSRPHRHQLNPFRLLPFPTDQWTGNPGLQPEFTQNIELNYSFEKQKVQLRSGAYVRLRRNDMTPITEAINDQLVR
ncbi:MAG: TonB-dependent receptor, partial [Bacteroidota bacterium]